MKRLPVVLFVLVFALSAAGQTVIFEEHFTDGTVSDEWFNPWEEQPDLVAEVDETTPEEDGFVGSLGSGGMVGTALAGTADLTDYRIDSWVKITVEQLIAHGICARFDTTGGQANFSYYYLRPNFNTTDMPPAVPELQLRVYPGESGRGQTLVSWLPEELPGGAPEDESWHRIGLEVIGNTLQAYWDDEALLEEPLEDDSRAAGFFGVYIFSMEPDAVTIVDGIVVTTTEDDTNRVADTETIVQPSTASIVSTFPNPFNPTTTISVESSGLGNASLAVYDVLGRRVSTLLKGTVPSGKQEYNFDASGLTAGMYFAVLEAENVKDVRKIILLK